jgi:hypothetical protein
LHFFYSAFSIGIKRVEGLFIDPFHLIDICFRIQAYRRTSSVAPRFHLKSTIGEAYVAWKLYRMEHFYNEAMYMSYTPDLGAYHTKRLKRHIEALPELFGQYKNLTLAESILHYAHNGREFYCEPSGIMSFKRGKHPNFIICDDILKDPQVKLDISQLKKIEEAYFGEVENMPKEDLHLFGTPQDQEDLFAMLETKSEYNCKRYTAEFNPIKKEAWWQDNPQFDWAALQRKRLMIGDKLYRKEFLCMPVRGEEGFISINQLNAIINKRLKHYDVMRPPKLRNRNVVAGFDIGKKTHPSHLCVLAEHNNKLIQLHSKFMDGWDYTDQIAYLCQAIKVFKIDALLYDDTRAEFEASYEQGQLAGEMSGVAFTAKTKFAMATELDKLVTNKSIQLLDDERQKRQIITVDCDLQAPDTAEGHGDAFFSLCLAVKAWADARGDVAWIA